MTRHIVGLHKWQCHLWLIGVVGMVCTVDGRVSQCWLVAAEYRCSSVHVYVFVSVVHPIILLCKKVINLKC